MIIIVFVIIMVMIMIVIIVITRMMLIGAMGWAWVSGALCGILATLNPHATAFQNLMDELNYFMSDMNIDQALRVRSQACARTFLAEGGDRAQSATSALAAAKDPYGVVAGGVVGHAMCTGLAVVGGRMLAARISEKHVAVCGGLIFLGFAVYSFLVEDPQA